MILRKRLLSPYYGSKSIVLGFAIIAGAVLAHGPAAAGSGCLEGMARVFGA